MLPFELTKDTPYLALSGELWSVFYEYFNRNWPCYKGFLLYLDIYENNTANSKFYMTERKYQVGYSLRRAWSCTIMHYLFTTRYLFWYDAEVYLYRVYILHFTSKCKDHKTIINLKLHNDSFTFQYVSLLHPTIRHTTLLKGTCALRYTSITEYNDIDGKPYSIIQDPIRKGN